MSSILESLKNYPLMYVGVVIILASLGPGAMGFSVDPEKWVAGVMVGIALIGFSIIRSKYK